VAAAEPSLVGALMRAAKDQLEDRHCGGHGGAGHGKTTNICTVSGLPHGPTNSSGVHNHGGRPNDNNASAFGYAFCDNRYDGSILGAVGERQGEDGPMWVKLKNTALQWEKYTPVMGWGDNNAMAERYDNPANRLTPFDARVEAKGDVQWIPKAPMLPMEVALNLAQKPTTLWELLELLEEFLADKDPQVGTALDPIKKWAVAAATQGKDEKQCHGHLPTASDDTFKAVRSFP